MQIKAINNKFYINSNQNNKQNTKEFGQNKEFKHPSLAQSKAYFVNFTGGSSLNLKESVQNLDNISNAQGEKFPKDIWESAKEVIESGNKDLTLIDVHKNKYKALNTMWDLEEAKKMYPEFREVKSDKDVDYRANSFIDEVKKGENKNFNKDEDLAFQLLKLYWAEGFSLTDLENEAGKNIYHTMKKLNIPMMDRDYAHVLKFSDKEYNKRFGEKMAQKRLETKDRLEFEKTGEPVYIPKGELSQEHKKHISEGLIKHYAEHPEKLAKISERQKAYFEENPEQKELMTTAMLEAWKTQEGKSVQKYMIKFFKKEGEKFDENILDGSKRTNKQNEIFKQFWQINSWAKPHFSTAVKKGWEVARDKAERKKIEDVMMEGAQAAYPDKYIKEIADWYNNNCNSKKKINIDKSKDIAKAFGGLERFNHIKKAYIKEKGGHKDKLALVAMNSVICKYAEKTRPKNIKKHKDEEKFSQHPIFWKVASEQTREFIKRESSDGKILDESSAVILIAALTQTSKLCEFEDFSELFHKEINEVYKIISGPDSEIRKAKFYNYMNS